jgi:hypothetical protein
VIEQRTGLARLLFPSEVVSHHQNYIDIIRLLWENKGGGKQRENKGDASDYRPGK